MTGKTYREIAVTTLANGYRVALPVHEITGGRPGPTLGMTALLHGDELLPNVVFRRLWQELDPAGLRGKVIMIPVANPLALESYTRNTPLDMSNLNRVFPGAADGMFTEQLAHVIMEEFVPALDYLVDWHAGGTFPVVDYVFKSPGAPTLGHAFGLSVIYDAPIFEGALANLTEKQGIPSIVVEIGGGAVLDERYIELGIRGAFNVLKELDMLDGDPVVPDEQFLVKQLATIRPQTGGVLYPEVSLDHLGKVVPGGSVLGRVISPYTFEQLEVLEAPFERSLLVLVRGTPTRVNPGDYAFMVANPDAS